MKQKDVLTFIVVGIFSAVLSAALSNLLIVPKKAFNKKASVVDTITTDFNKPDSKYFNKDSIDPTKLITIGDNSNKLPFKDKN